MWKYPTFSLDIIVHSDLGTQLSLHVDSIQSLVFFFFSLDHYNYAHWLAVYLKDMKCLPSPLRDSFSMNWVVSKTSHRFAALPIDQVPEQEKAHVKGKGGCIGLTESPDALQRWTTGGPERPISSCNWNRFWLPSSWRIFSTKRVCWMCLK